MGQGQINMPAPGKSPIEGIMQALQAVHAYYGIDTQKQQQELLKAQTSVENLKAEQEGNKTTAMKQWLERNSANPQAAPDASAPAQPEPQQPKGLSLGVDTGMPGNTISPLKGMIQQVTSPMPRQAAAPKSSVTPEDLQNPFLAPQLEPMLKAQQTAQGLQKGDKEMQHLDQQMQFAANEDKRKGEDQLLHVQNEFNNNSSVKEAKDDISASQAVNAALASGNKADIQLAKAKLPLLALGIKRLGGEGAELADSKKLADMLDEFVALKASGKPTTEAVQMLQGVASRIQTSASQRLSDLADTASAQAGNVLGRDANEVKQKLILPRGTQAKEMKPVDSASDPEDQWQRYLQKQKPKNGTATMEVRG